MEAGRAPHNEQFQYLDFQHVGWPELSYFSNRKVVSFAFNSNNEPPIIHVSNRVRVPQRN